MEKKSTCQKRQERIEHLENERYQIFLAANNALAEIDKLETAPVVDDLWLEKALAVARLELNFISTCAGGLNDETENI